LKTVTYREKTTGGAPAVITVTHRRQPLVGARNSASLPVITKEQRFRAPSFSRFSPEVTADDVEKSLKEQLSIKNLVCKRLKTKFSTYASFHVSVIEDEFSLISNNGV
jgi:hypothetical protein